MSLLRRVELDDSPDAPEALHLLAQQKVRTALAGLGGAAAPPLPEEPAAPATTVATPKEPGQDQDPDADQDPVVAAALARLSDRVSDLSAVDGLGRPVSRAELVRAVLGPLPARDRDADTTAALLHAVRPPVVAECSSPAVSPRAPGVDLRDEPTRRAEAVIHEQMLLEGGLQRHVFRTDPVRIERPA